MIVVVPPQAAARVPVSKVSDAAVPPKGNSMCVWASIPPGMTYLPAASITVSTFAVRSVPSSVEPGVSTATTVSPSMSTSACTRPVAETTVPFLMRVFMVVSLRLRDARVRVGSAVAVELPVVAHLLHHVEVEVTDDELLRVARALLPDEVAAGVDDLARAVEVDGELAVLVVLTADPVGLQHEVSVRDGGAGPLDLPQPVRET